MITAAQPARAGFAGNRRRHGWAWIMLAVAIALHVADEATHDFLAVYNPAVRTIRQRVPWLPLPTFEFGEWIAGLAAGVVLLLALSPLVFRGARIMRPISFVLAALMALNALQHAAGSVYMGRLMPGALSSPVLLAAALWLAVTAQRTPR
ncbi:MAG TPA: hypothetical protein VFL57_02390 [Bryobacteraceae bacterium]|nr:hypothetical protein [Bryobacteraceae bacterium]